MKMSNSTHQVEIVPVELLPHPNADSLSIVKVWGYQCVVKTADWAGKSVGAYIPPDSVCPDTPEFEFLGKRKRIRAVKLRGQLSMGLLMPAPDGAKVGDDVAEILGVTHYEPPIKGSKNGQEAGSEAEVAPPEIAHLPKYDVDSLRRYTDVFATNEVVWITEKIHGASSKFAYRDGRMWCGSRTEWKKQDKNNLWWRALEATPEIELFCRAYPDHVLYGEVYGQVQDLRYGIDQGVRFVAFDVRMCAGPFVDPEPARDMLLDCEVPMVPMITVAPFNLDKVIAMAEGPSILARQNGVDQVREGCVVKPLHERWHPECGRAILKVVGLGYYDRT